MTTKQLKNVKTPTKRTDANNSLSQKEYKLYSERYEQSMKDIKNIQFKDRPEIKVSNTDAIDRFICNHKIKDSAEIVLNPRWYPIHVVVFDGTLNFERYENLEYQIDEKGQYWYKNNKFGGSYRPGQEALKGPTEDSRRIYYKRTNKKCKKDDPRVKPTLDIIKAISTSNCSDLIILLLDAGFSYKSIGIYLKNNFKEFETTDLDILVKFISQNFESYYRNNSREIINTIRSTNEILKKYQSKLNLNKFSVGSLFDNPEQFKISNNLQAKEESKVLTGVKDIKEFSEPVQKIVSIFKGEDSAKITEKEEIKIEEEKTIIEENENETLINQIKVKQQELSQLIDKLYINLSN